MTYKLSGREVGTILLDIYAKHHHIAMQMESATHPFPAIVLEHWRNIGAVSHEVKDGFFAYYDQAGNKHPHNPFVFGRLQNAIDKGFKTYDEIREHALYAPLLKPDKAAIKYAEKNIREYLRVMGGEDLLQQHFPILEMLTAYHRHDLHPFSHILGKVDTHKTVDTPRSFASELYHKFGGNVDWEALAHFMIYDTKLQSEGENLLTKYGDCKIYKSPLQTACDGCKALYLDGVKPRLYRISELIHNGAVTIEQRMEEEAAAIPTFGPSHLWCNCSGPFPFTGMEWWAEETKTEAPASSEDTPITEPLILKLWDKIKTYL